MSPEVQNRGITGPTKRADILEKFKKEEVLKFYSFKAVQPSGEQSWCTIS